MANPRPEDHEEKAVSAESIAKAELDKKAHKDALNRYASLCTAIGEMGASVSEILQMPNPADVLKFADFLRIEAASDILLDWITKQEARNK